MLSDRDAIADNPRHAQAIELAEFATIDWSTQNEAPPGRRSFSPIVSRPELTLVDSEYAAVVSLRDAVSAADEVFAMSLLQREPASDDDGDGIDEDADFDGDGVPIHLDLDSDGDGRPDSRDPQPFSITACGGGEAIRSSSNTGSGTCPER